MALQKLKTVRPSHMLSYTQVTQIASGTLASLACIFFVKLKVAVFVLLCASISARARSSGAYVCAPVAAQLVCDGVGKGAVTKEPLNGRLVDFGAPRPVNVSPPRMLQCS